KILPRVVNKLHLQELNRTPQRLHQLDRLQHMHHSQYKYLDLYKIGLYLLQYSQLYRHSHIHLTFHFDKLLKSRMPFSVPSFVSQQPIIILSYMKKVRFVNFFATFTNFDTNKNLLFYSILNLLTVCCNVSDCSANEEASSASL